MSIGTVFNHIYSTNRWLFGSGTGALAFNNQSYIRFLQRFLDSHPDINTVLDLGCGDWQIGSQIDWGERHYIGIDASDFIIAKTQARYASATIRFRVLNAVDEELPDADLIIIKDVLEHLSNENIDIILKKTEKYSYVLIQNDIGVLTTLNENIRDGGYRKLDVSAKPFAYRCELAKTYVELHLQLLLSFLFGVSAASGLVSHSFIVFLMLVLYTVVMTIEFMPIKAIHTRYNEKQ